MSKTKIIFSFDTEDLVHKDGADGILNTIKVLDKTGIKGCFNIVGLLPEKLEQWGRYDVIEALKNHEIDLHSYDHSFKPTINEYTNTADYAAAMKEFLKRENRGVEIIDRVLGKRPHPAACPPGFNVSYVAHYGYAKMGVKVYCGDYVYDWLGGRPFYFCNLLTTEYDLCFDWYLLQPITKEDIKERLDWIANNKVLYTFCHHPDRGIYDEHWDLLNFYDKNTPENEYRFANRYPQEQIDAFYERMEMLIEEIKADERFEIVTYQELYERDWNNDRIVSLDMIPEIYEQIKECLFPVTVPLSLSLCDIFHACRAFLLGEKEYRCEESYGFLGEPFIARRPMEFTKEQFVKSAETLRDHGFLPEFVYVDGIKIGPADWLRGALEILSGSEKVRIIPNDWQIDTWRIKGLTDMKNGMNRERYEHLARASVLQTWTIRFQKGSQRMYS